MESDFLRDFALNQKETSVLVSLQKSLITEDISETENQEIKEKKKIWLEKWEELVTKGFAEIKGDSPKPKFLTEKEINKEIEAIKDKRLQAALILLEFVLFKPYFKIATNKEDIINSAKFKGLKIGIKPKNDYYKNISTALGFDSDKALDFYKLNKKTVNQLSGKNKKIILASITGIALGALTFGIAAPAIGAGVGAAAGLSGAAATSAGLAAIGGGSIAAGGLGIAGGTAILVGGGSLLGLSLGAGSSLLLAAMNKNTAIFLSAKMEVTLKEIILQGQYDIAKIQEIFFQQNEAIKIMKSEIKKLDKSQKEDAKRIKELGKVIRILKKSRNRTQNIINDTQEQEVA